jgi:LmbE family N-acetylglucosaminyl deacetylase
VSAQRCIQSATDIQQLGTILSVWAHPDDETFCAGGLMATAVKNGQTVICVMATKGQAGSHDPKKWPPETLGDVRIHELKNGLDILGVQTCHCLNYMDGACRDIESSIPIRQLQKVISHYQPDTILTFGPDGLTGHPDHATVSGWVSRAVEHMDSKPTVFHNVQTPAQYKQLKPADEKLDIFFNIDKPPLKEPEQCAICYELPADIRQLKYRAFAAMPSQTERMFELLDEEFICSALGTEAFVKAK